jgi:hypothetical protein
MTSSKTTNQSKDYSWYAKWFGSISILLAIGVRGSGVSQEADIILSMIGTLCWTYVAISWKDRAMMMMNGAATLFLLPSTITILAKLI